MSKVAFLGRGVTTADFIDRGTSLDLSEALMMSVIVGSSSYLAFLRMQVDIRSNVQRFEVIYI